MALPVLSERSDFSHEEAVKSRASMKAASDIQIATTSRFGAYHVLPTVLVLALDIPS